MLRFLSLVFIFFQLVNTLSAQTTLTGRVLDENQKALPSINILVYPRHSEALIAFGVSDREGRFRIALQNAADSLMLVASSMHYRNDTLLIANKSKELQYDLIPEVKDLDEFVVRAAPITQRGDTISYLVSSFAREQDRSIGDVLKQMPGVEVESSGRVLYQGSPIQHLYVEGMDLMGGRYGMVTQNMPHRSVATVEVLENHQPIRILEDRVPSHQASLNIRLKREITTTGTANLGAGAAPVLWNGNITPMTFTRNFQVVNSYQSNNTGHDVSQQLRSLSAGGGISIFFDNASGKNEILGIPQLSPPDFSRERHLDNHVHLINTNALQRLKNDLELRANLFYVYDAREQNGFSRSTFYTPEDTIITAEEIHNQINMSYLQGEISLNRNTTGNYLNNVTRFKKHWDTALGNIEGGGMPLSQSLDNPFAELSNKLSIIKPIMDRLIRFNSEIEWQQSPQSLKVSPVQFSAMDNIGSDWQHISQHTTYQAAKANHSMSFNVRKGRWSFGPELGFEYQRNTLHSVLEGPGGTPDGLFANNYQADSRRAYARMEANYRKGRFNFTSRIPLSYRNIQMQDRQLDRMRQRDHIAVEPGISFGYRITSFWDSYLRYNYANTLGEPGGIHYAYIMKNYRSMQINDAPLAETSRHSVSASLNYRNPIKSFFNYLSYTFSHNTNNLLYSNLIQDDGSSIRESLLRPNSGISHSINARTSKYFDPISSTLSLQTYVSHNSRMEFLNGMEYDAESVIYMLSPQWNIRFSEKVSAEYKARMNFFNTYRDEAKAHQIQSYRHDVGLHYFPARNQFISIQGEYYQHHDNHDYFVDLHYRYTFTRQRIDVDFKWNNIFNHGSYQDFHVGPYSLIENYYPLRPSRFLVSVRFGF